MKTLMTAWLVALTAAIALLAIRSVEPSDAAEQPTSATFDRLTVHRLDVVEPDGKPRVILSDAAAYPGAYVDGVEYPHPGRPSRGGVLFFNDDGTEAGGVGYATKLDNGKRTSGAMISMDQYNQSEILNLAYSDDDGRRVAGLNVYGDHPDAGRATMNRRVFVGRDQDDALVSLGDKAGTKRLVVQVDANGEPTIQFFDAAGKLTKTLGAR